MTELLPTALEPPQAPRVLVSDLPAIHPDVKVTAEGHVTTVTIDRPDTKNACTGDMWVAIGETFRRLAYSGTRVIVLTGGGTDFCAGADLSGSGASGSGGASSERTDGQPARRDARARRRGRGGARMPGAHHRRASTASRSVPASASRSPAT